MSRNFLLLLGLGAGMACGDSDDADPGPYDAYLGEYDTQMQVTESDCPLSFVEQSLAGRLSVVERNARLFFEGPFLLDSILTHEMKWSPNGQLEHDGQVGGRSFRVTGAVEGDGLAGSFSLQMPGCNAKGLWKAAVRR